MGLEIVIQKWLHCSNSNKDASVVSLPNSGPRTDFGAVNPNEWPSKSNRIGPDGEKRLAPQIGDIPEHSNV